MTYAPRLCCGYLALVAVLLPAASRSVVAGQAAADAASPPLSITIDARDLPRKLLHASLNVPITKAAEAQKLAFWYPKWVPGSHGPGGPIANLAGLKIEDEEGNLLNWARTPGEVYRIEVEVPAGVQQLNFELRYIANQPTTNSMGHDVFGSPMIGLVSSGSVLFYQEGTDIDETEIVARLLLPKDWSASSALKGAGDDESSVQYEPTTLRTLVDSPIMCGRYQSIYSLNTPDFAVAVAPHSLHVYGDSPSATDLNQEILDTLRGVVSQTALLMDSQPFDEFTVLLAVTDQLPANGLEHSRSTMNVLPPSSLASLAALKGWSRLLIPHEYLHSWCGKYRRPSGMVNSDFHTPKDTQLLWVYEGLTQYLGELMEARSGLMSGAEFRHRLAVELRNAQHQQNRQWRSLADTAAASHVLRGSSTAWPRLRGSQDYYMEGMLLWLEIDAELRSRSGGEISIDDFCKQFFKSEAGQSTAHDSRPVAFSREEVVEILDGLAEHDWDGLIRRRVESPQQSFDSSLANLLGYRFEASSSRPKIPASTFRYPSGIDEYDSVGAVFAPDGTVKDILLGGAADNAKLGPGMQVVGVNGRKWSAKILREAIENSSDSAPIELLVSQGELLKTIQLQYYAGSSYLTLSRDETKPDLLDAILKPL